jgi:hypothetical protein
MKKAAIHIKIQAAVGHETKDAYLRFLISEKNLEEAIEIIYTAIEKLEKLHK